MNNPTIEYASMINLQFYRLNIDSNDSVPILLNHLQYGKYSFLNNICVQADRPKSLYMLL